MVPADSMTGSGFTMAVRGTGLQSVLLLAAGIALVLTAGCSSQDFGSPVATITDLGDDGAAYVADTDEEEALVRARRLAKLLTSWEEERRGETRDYSVGSDDVLEIGILALEQPGETAILPRTVLDDGTIALPLVGDLTVVGLAPQEIEDLVVASYRDKYIKDPSVTVKISEYRSAPVVLTGAVNEPGVYYLRHNNSTILEILAEADGLSSTAGDSLMIVRRVNVDRNGAVSNGVPAEALTPPADGTGTNGPPSQQEASAVDESGDPDMITIDLERLLVHGDIDLNATVQGGDIITVPPREAAYIYVLGYVQAPGAFELRGKDRVRSVQAVAMAGGLASSARAENSFLITQRTGERQVVQVDLSKIARGVRPPLYMQSGDTLIVGSGLLARLGEFVKPSVGASASLTPMP